MTLAQTHKVDVKDDRTDGLDEAVDASVERGVGDSNRGEQSGRLRRLSDVPDLSHHVDPRNS